MSDGITSETFSPLVGENFVLESGEHRLEVRLAEVNILGSGAGGEASRIPFSLLFLGPPDPVWRQQIYRVVHADQGAFDIFLVPTGPDGQHMGYEAVFT